MPRRVLGTHGLLVTVGTILAGCQGDTPSGPVFAPPSSPAS